MAAKTPEELHAGFKEVAARLNRTVEDQARRTAWKLLVDWVQVQASMILIGRRTALEVFLPYVYNHETKQTFFERMQESKFKMLNP